MEGCIGSEDKAGESEGIEEDASVAFGYASLEEGSECASGYDGCGVDDGSEHVAW